MAKTKKQIKEALDIVEKMRRQVTMRRRNEAAASQKMRTSVSARKGKKVTPPKSAGSKGKSAGSKSSPKKRKAPVVKIEQKQKKPRGFAKLDIPIKNVQDEVMEIIARVDKEIEEGEASAKKEVEKEVEKFDDTDSDDLWDADAAALEKLLLSSVGPLNEVEGVESLKDRKAFEAELKVAREESRAQQELKKNKSSGECVLFSTYYV